MRRFIATLLWLTLFCGGVGLLAVEGVQASKVKEPPSAHRRQSCAVPLGIWRSGNWVQARGENQCGWQVSVETLEYVRDQGRWVMQSGTGWAWNTNFTQAQCKYSGSPSDARAWENETFTETNGYAEEAPPERTTLECVR